MTESLSPPPLEPDTDKTAAVIHLYYLNIQNEIKKSFKPFILRITRASFLLLKDSSYFCKYKDDPSKHDILNVNKNKNKHDKYDITLILYHFILFCVDFKIITSNYFVAQFIVYTFI